MAQAARLDATTERATTRSRGADFVSLTKPRLNSLVLVTTAAAYFLPTAIGCPGCCSCTPWWAPHSSPAARRP